jgi:hypothetical protein
MQAGIAEQHFEVGAGGRIAVEYGGDVFMHQLEEGDHFGLEFPGRECTGGDPSTALRAGCPSTDSFL